MRAAPLAATAFITASKASRLAWMSVRIAVSIVGAELCGAADPNAMRLRNEPRFPHLPCLERKAKAASMLRQRQPDRRPVLGDGRLYGPFEIGGQHHVAARRDHARGVVDAPEQVFQA